MISSESDKYQKSEKETIILINMLIMVSKFGCPTELSVVLNLTFIDCLNVMQKNRFT